MRQKIGRSKHRSNDPSVCPSNETLEFNTMLLFTVPRHQRRNTMKQSEGLTNLSANRRSFLKKGVMGAGAAAMAAGLLPGSLVASARGEDDGVPITKGDIAILRFLQALEQVEADLWIQYSELGGTQDNEVSGVNGGNPAYTQALQLLDGDMPQYIHDNTDDEISHASFLSNYLESIGVQP